MNLAGLLNQLLTDARLRVLGPERLFEIDSELALRTFIDNPINDKNIRVALRYFTKDHLALEYRENIMKHIRTNQDASAKLDDLFRPGLNNYYYKRIANLNQKLYNVMTRLYQE